MKIAVLSDIHSNLEALQACCRKAYSAGVEQFVCLGDTIGYGADPVETLELVMSLPGLVAVRGNHDEAAINGLFPKAKKSAQEAIAWTHQRLSSIHLKFLEDLPYVQTKNGAVYTHASLDKPSEWTYVFQPEQVKKCMRKTDQPLIFIGHTHFPRLYCDAPRGNVKQLDTTEGSAIPLFHQRRYLIDVGSVGQPRDGNFAASFVIHDTSSAEVTFHRVAYDFTETARKILDADLPPHFAHRLINKEWSQ